MSGNSPTEPQLRPSGLEVAADFQRIHKIRMWKYPSRWRSLLLRLAMGRRIFEYMLRSIRNDPRTPGARLVDIVVRQDGREVRTEADWVKTIARWTYHLKTPEIR